MSVFHPTWSLITFPVALLTLAFVQAAQRDSGVVSAESHRFAKTIDLGFQTFVRDIIFDRRGRAVLFGLGDGFDTFTVISPDGSIEGDWPGYHMMRSPDNRFVIHEDWSGPSPPGRPAIGRVVSIYDFDTGDAKNYVAAFPAPGVGVTSGFKWVDASTVAFTIDRRRQSRLIVLHLGNGLARRRTDDRSLGPIHGNPTIAGRIQGNQLLVSVTYENRPPIVVQVAR
jgi:hypothetical protein